MRQRICIDTMRAMFTIHKAHPAKTPLGSFI